MPIRSPMIPTIEPSNSQRPYGNLAIQMSVFYPIARSYGSLAIQMSVFYPITRSCGNLTIQMPEEYSIRSLNRIPVIESSIAAIMYSDPDATELSQTTAPGHMEASFKVATFLQFLTVEFTFLNRKLHNL